MFSIFIFLFCIFVYSIVKKKKEKRKKPFFIFFYFYGYCFMWGMLISESKAWIFCLVIFMLLIVVGCQILWTTLRIFTHIDNVHTTPTLIMVQVTIHYEDNFPIFQMSRGTPISLVWVWIKSQFLHPRLEQPFRFLVASSYFGKLCSPILWTAPSWISAVQ